MKNYYKTLKVKMFQIFVEVYKNKEVLHKHLILNFNSSNPPRNEIGTLQHVSPICTVVDKKNATLVVIPTHIIVEK